MNDEDRLVSIRLLEDILQKWQALLPASVDHRLGRCNALGKLQQLHLGKMPAAFDIHLWEKEIDVSHSYASSTFSSRSRNDVHPAAARVERLVTYGWI